MVIWLIGLSGAGKTTIGQEVYSILRDRRPNVIFLDGDDFRQVMGQDLGYTLEDRKINAGRLCRLCKLMDSQGIDVVCAVLSLFPESREFNRAVIPQYFEVYIQSTMDTLLKRDSKGLYRKALAGEMTDVAGVDLPFLPPDTPDIVIDNEDPPRPASELARMIVEAIPWESERCCA